MRLVSLVCIVAALISSSTVRAESEKEQARRHYRLGVNHFNLGEFDEALREFKESYRLIEDPAFLYNIAQCQRKSGDLRGALHSYRVYLRTGKDRTVLAEVEARVREIEAQLKAEEEKSRAALPAPPPAAVNASAAANVPTVVYPPTAAQATAESSGAQALPAPTLLPQVNAPAVSLNLNDQPSPAVQRTPVYKRWWVWTIAGVVVAGALTAGILLLGSSSTSRPDCPAGVRCG